MPMSPRNEIEISEPNTNATVPLSGVTVEIDDALIGDRRDPGVLGGHIGQMDRVGSGRDPLVPRGLR